MYARLNDNSLTRQCLHVFTLAAMFESLLGSIDWCLHRLATDHAFVTRLSGTSNSFHPISYGWWPFTGPMIDYIPIPLRSMTFCLSPDWLSKGFSYILRDIATCNWEGALIWLHCLLHVSFICLSDKPRDGTIVIETN